MTKFQELLEQAIRELEQKKPPTFEQAHSPLMLTAQVTPATKIECKAIINGK